MKKPKASVGKLITVVVLLFLAIIAVYLIDKRASQELICNGHKELCNRRLDEVAIAMTHNGMSIADYGWFGPSHKDSITNQLNAGIRGIMLDTHYYDAATSIATYFPDASVEQLEKIGKIVDGIKMKKKDGTYLCHLLCHLGSSILSEGLSEITTFLDENPAEVVVIIFEDKITNKDTLQAFEESELIKYVYTHSPDQPWPTLGELIKQNKRLVVMAEVENPPPAWYHHAWDYVEETPYSYKTAKEMNCIPNRGNTNKPFFLINHWLEKIEPSVEDAEKVNEYQFLLKRAQKCAKERNHRVPNFIAVNFYNRGDVIKVVDKLNNVNQTDSQ